MRIWRVAIMSLLAAGLALGPAPDAEAKRSRKRSAAAKDKKKKLRSYWIRPQGEMGYEWYTISGDGEAIKTKGFHFALPVHASFVLLPYTLHGIGLAGLGFAFGNGSVGLDAANVKFKFNPVFLQLGGGLAYMVTKTLNLEGYLKYDVGFTGSAEATSSFGTTGFDIVDFKRFHFNLPSVRYELDKSLSLGGGLSFYSGTMQLKDLNEGAIRDPLKQKGTALNFFFASQF